jgi:DnaK suppressor protein
MASRDVEQKGLKRTKNVDKKTNKKMTSSEREQIRQKLQDTILKVQNEIAELKELTKPIAPDSAIGRISRMDAINNKSVNDAGLRKSKVKLSKLEKNLERIDDEDFGNCTRCGKEIQVGRIAVGV